MFSDLIPWTKIEKKCSDNSRKTNNNYNADPSNDLNRYRCSCCCSSSIFIDRVSDGDISSSDERLIKIGVESCVNHKNSKKSFQNSLKDCDGCSSCSRQRLRQRRQISLHHHSQSYYSPVQRNTNNFSSFLQTRWFSSLNCSLLFCNFTIKFKRICNITRTFFTKPLNNSIIVIMSFILHNSILLLQLRNEYPSNFSKKIRKGKNETRLFIIFYIILQLSTSKNLFICGVDAAIDGVDGSTDYNGSTTVTTEFYRNTNTQADNNNSNNNISDIVDKSTNSIINLNHNWISREHDGIPPNYDEHTNGHFTQSWTVHIPDGHLNGLADRVAADHGFINYGKICDGHYVFHHNSVAKRSLEPANHYQKHLEDDDRVFQSKQERAKSRSKRDFIRMRPSRTSTFSSSLVNSVQLNDAKWSQMWYLNRGNGLDMNVIPAWKEGITGKGIVVTILDDGLETNHPDLEHNYDPKASYDVNSHDEDPMPHYDMTDSNRHGTRCAGEVAATANNSLCAVGIAYGARVGGVRMLDGDVTDSVEARSLSLNPQYIDIYSASWGPDDDGKTVDGPGEYATRAFIEGVTKGRNGKGSIFIWASGNGGREQDNCNCDGYTNSIWTLSISSATEEGDVPWYSEKCSSTLATTYSSGGQNEKQVITTDLHHSCTSSHTGTSASAPLAAGIAALVLEANQNLTWRDLQHIVVRTAKPGNLKDSTWSKNGVGRRVSHSFGYGLMDAAAMVKTARTWKQVPEQQKCEVNAPHMDKMIPPKEHITLQLNVKHCLNVNFLEHVQAKITLTSQRRGDIQIYLKSPAGTKVTLLTTRAHDLSRSGFNQWPFMSVHTWGEAPHGNWQLEIHNEGRFMGFAALKAWSLIFYGTTLPICKNDPISVRPPNTVNISTISSSPSSSSGSHHQIYSAEYPIISNTNQYPITISNKPNFKISFGSNVSGSHAAGPTSNNNNNQGYNRKQPQQEQMATYGVILSSIPKKTNNNMGKSHKNKDKSNAGGGGKSSGGQNNQKASLFSLSTNRPLQSYQSTVGQQQSIATQGSRNNFYRISKLPSKATGVAAVGNLTVGKLQNSPSSSVSTQRIKNYQQSNYNSNYNGGKSDRPSRIHEKIAIKAPKQVKQDVQQQQFHSYDSSVEQQRFWPATPPQNPRIPNLFEQYDKIQHIFPEFHPYIGPKEGERGGTSSSSSSSSSADNQPKPLPNKKQYPSSEPPGSINNIYGQQKNKNLAQTSGLPTSSLLALPSSSSAVGGTSSSSTSTYSSIGNSHSVSAGTFITNSAKPSRENTKKLQHNLQEDRERSGEIYLPNSNRKNIKAQVTHWDLIFYGTASPAQPDDHLRIDPGPYGSYGEELEHNQIYDPETASGQWRNMQQIGEHHMEVQRTAEDVTSTSCVDFTPDQRCIECIDITYLYNERCYTACPNRTYVLEEGSIAKFTNGNEDNGTEPLNLHFDMLHLRSTNFGGENLDILPSAFSHLKRAGLPPPSSRRNLCASCHLTCQNCRGPRNSDCTHCPSGVELHVVSSIESYCSAERLVEDGNNLSRSTSIGRVTNFPSTGIGSDDNEGAAVYKMQKNENSTQSEQTTDEGDNRADSYIFMIIVLPALLLIIIAFIITIFKPNFTRICYCLPSSNRTDSGPTYNRISFNAPDEEAFLDVKRERIKDNRNEPEVFGGSRRPPTSAMKSSGTGAGYSVSKNLIPVANQSDSDED